MHFLSGMAKIQSFLQSWQDTFCGKPTPGAFMIPASQFDWMTRWWWCGKYSWPANLPTSGEINLGCEWVMRLQPDSDNLSAFLCVYWDTWKAAVINQVGFHFLCSWPLFHHLRFDHWSLKQGSTLTVQTAIITRIPKNTHQMEKEG